MSQKKRICIIGGGSSGITAAKALLEEGMEPAIYEKAEVLGGLWAYHDEDVDGLASVMKSTIINTSKEMSAFSDFPPPKGFPNYMHNTMMLKYFLAYAEQFGITKYAKFRQEIVKVTPNAEYDSTGRWDAVIKDLNTGESRNEVFDGVLICIGHHVYPHVPTFPGQEKFKGRIVHTHSLKIADSYKDKRVVIVGIGNSAVDAAVECSMMTPNVYLSTRRGAWIIKRVGPKGLPGDITVIRRDLNVLRHILPENFVNSYLENQSNEIFDHEVYGVKPKHRFNAQHPTLNDALPNRILSGTVKMKGNIKTFTEKGIIFEGDDEETELDDVILATGYQIKFPFLPDDIITTRDNRVQLYKYIFPPQLKHPSLAVVGLIQPVGAIFPIAELHCRWYAQLMRGNVRLPSSADMKEDIRKKTEALKRRYVDSPRHTIQVDWIDYMDEISSQIGAKPNLLKLFFTDNKLFWACFKGPCVSYQYRLQGPHPWPGARDAILQVNERISAPFTNKFKDDSSSAGRIVLMYVFFAGLVAFLAYTLAGQRHF